MLQSKNNLYVHNYICSKCMCRMEQHPELNGWRKCNCCGYSIEIPRKFMIIMKELNPSNAPVSEEVQKNMDDLLVKLNKFRTAYALPMKVTSGLRTMEDHLRIYKNINDKRKDQGLDPVKIPMGSAHLNGLACDFADPQGTLYQWAFNNQKLMEEIGLWAEEGTVGWLHLQSRPAKNRFFKP